MTIACRITGMPFLLPYTEGLDDLPSPEKNLINSGKIVDAIKLAGKLKNEQRIQLLIELAISYLHQPGTHNADLARADKNDNGVKIMVAFDGSKIMKLYKIETAKETASDFIEELI